VNNQKTTKNAQSKASTANNCYTDAILNKAKKIYKAGIEVISPMTGNKFTIKKITDTWHKEYIKGFDEQFFFDVVWYKGQWAKIIN